MKLIHRTPAGPTILKEGFNLCHTPDRAGNEGAWFPDNLEATNTYFARKMPGVGISSAPQCKHT